MSLLFAEDGIKNRWSHIDLWLMMDTDLGLDGLSKFIYYYMHSQPKGWKFRIQHLCKICNCNKDTVLKRLALLHNNNLFYNFKIQNVDTGKMAGYASFATHYQKDQNEAIAKFEKENPLFKVINVQKETETGFPEHGENQYQEKPTPEGNSHCFFPSSVAEQIPVENQYFGARRSLSTKEHDVTKEHQSSTNVEEEREAQPSRAAKTPEGDQAHVQTKIIKRVEINVPNKAKLTTADVVEHHSPKKAIKTAPETTKEADTSLSRKGNGPASSRKTESLTSLTREIMLFWISMGLRSPKDEKAEKRAISKLERALRGTLLASQPGYENLKDRKFTKEEIIQAIKNFHLAATDPKYRPGVMATKQKMLKMDINTWLLNEFVKKHGVATSSFLTNLEPPKLVSSPKILPVTEDLHPEVTEVLKREFCKVVSQTEQPLAPWDVRDENNFRKTANFLYDFYEQNKHRISDIFKSRESGTPKGLAKMLVRCVMQSSDSERFQVTTGWLCSSKTLNTRFPYYVKEDIKLFKSTGGVIGHPGSVRNRNLDIFRQQGIIIESPNNGY